MIFFLSRQSNFQILKARGFWITIFLHSRQLNFEESFKFENLIIVSGEILRSTESRSICFSYDQNAKNILKLLISVEKKFGRASSCRNGIPLRFYANRWHMCSISYYFRNFSASINSVTNVNYDIDLYCEFSLLHIFSLVLQP